MNIIKKLIFEIISNKFKYFNNSSTRNSPDSPFPLNNIHTSPHSHSHGYQYYHFTSSSDGTLITLDRNTGELIWQLRLETPIIGMYLYENEQLYKINFAVFAVEALTNQNPDRYRLLFLEQQYQEKQRLLYEDQQIDNSNPVSSNLFAYTLYIGFYKNNLYALPALIYNWHIPGIEGPPVPSSQLQPTNSIETSTSGPVKEETPTNELIVKESSTKAPRSPAEKLKDIIKIGHHKLPEKFKPPPNYIQTNTKNSFLGSDSSSDSNWVTPSFYHWLVVEL